MADISTNGAPVPHSNGHNPSPQEEDLISLQDILEVLWRGKWLALAVFAVVFGLTATYTFIQAPDYESSSTVLIDTDQAQSGGKLNLEQMITSGMGSNRSVQNEIEILKSRSVAARVARRIMDLGTVPGTDTEFKLLEVEEDREEPFTIGDLINRLRENTRISQVNREVDMIEVTVTSNSPEEAAAVANFYVEEYLQRNQEKSRSEISASRKFLEKQKEQYEAELKQIERELETFMENERVVALDAKAETLVEQMAQLESLRDETNVELEMARASLRTLRERANEIEPGLAKRISSGLEQEISSLQQKKGELETQRELIYSKNPDLRQEGVTNEQLQELNDQIANLQEQIDGRAQRYVEEVMSSGGIDPSTTQGGDGSNYASTLAYLTELQRNITERTIEVNGHEARLTALEQRIGEYQQDFDRIPGGKIRLAQLERSREANEQIYTFLVEKLQETRVAEQSELGYAETVDEAVVPDEPVSPKVPLNLLLGLVLGGFLGVGAVFLRHAMDTRIHDPQALEAEGVALTGIIPEMEEQIQKPVVGGSPVTVNGREVDGSLVAHHSPFAPQVEAYRQLRTSLQFSRPDEKLQVLMITSAHPGEGKTTTASNLAIVAAQMGKKTVLVDADLRKPRVHHRFSLNRKPGLVDLLFEEGSLDFDRYRTEIENLSVIPVGTATPNPSKVLGARKMDDFIDRLRDEYEFVIFDTAPLFVVADSMSLAAKCDGCVSVVRVDKTDRAAVKRTLDRLEEVGATAIGAVLNRYTDRSLFQSYYGYGYGYGQYGYEEEYHNAPTAS
jgi:capsular exopolysaccharide synthesis family protein